MVFADLLCLVIVAVVLIAIIGSQEKRQVRLLLLYLVRDWP